MLDKKRQIMKNQNYNTGRKIDPQVFKTEGKYRE